MLAGEGSQISGTNPRDSIKAKNVRNERKRKKRKRILPDPKELHAQRNTSLTFRVNIDRNNQAGNDMKHL